MTNKECNFSWPCFRNSRSMAFVKTQSRKRVCTAVSGSSRVGMYTHSMMRVLHAKCLQLCSLRKANCDGKKFQLPPQCSLGQVHSLRLHLESGVSKAYLWLCKWDRMLCPLAPRLCVLHWGMCLTKWHLCCSVTIIIEWRKGVGNSNLLSFLPVQWQWGNGDYRFRGSFGFLWVFWLQQ